MLRCRAPTRGARVRVVGLVVGEADQALHLRMCFKHQKRMLAESGSYRGVPPGRFLVMGCTTNQKNKKNHPRTSGWQRVQTIETLAIPTGMALVRGGALTDEVTSALQVLEDYVVALSLTDRVRDRAQGALLALQALRRSHPPAPPRLLGTQDGDGRKRPRARPQPRPREAAPPPPVAGAVDAAAREAAVRRAREDEGRQQRRDESERRERREKNHKIWKSAAQALGAGGTAFCTHQVFAHAGQHAAEADRHCCAQFLATQALLTTKVWLRRGPGQCGCVGVAAAGRQYTLSDGPINNSRWADQCPAENALIQQEYSELDEADAYKTPRYVSLSISRPVPAAVCAVGVHARY